MWDGKGTQIGYMKRTQAGASASAKMGSKLEDLLVITPEWAKGGYIQFQLGALGFNTEDDTEYLNPAKAGCHWGGFDPRQGPVCFVSPGDGAIIPVPGAYSKNQVDCSFPSVSASKFRVLDGYTLTSNSLTGMVGNLRMDHHCSFQLKWGPRQVGTMECSEW